MDGWVDGWMDAGTAAYLSNPHCPQHASLRATGAGCVRYVPPPHRIDEPREPYLRSARRHGVIGTRTIVANSALLYLPISHTGTHWGGCLQKRRAARMSGICQSKSLVRYVGTDLRKYVFCFLHRHRLHLPWLGAPTINRPPAGCGVTTNIT